MDGMRLKPKRHQLQDTGILTKNRAPKFKKSDK